MKVMHGTGCLAAGWCSRSHCWHSGVYHGDLCAWVTGDHWQPCPNLVNPKEYEIPGTSGSAAAPVMPQGHHYTGPGHYTPERRLV